MPSSRLRWIPPALGWAAALAAALLARRGVTAWAWGPALALSALAALPRWSSEPASAGDGGARRRSRAALALVLVAASAALWLRFSTLERVPRIVVDEEARRAIDARAAAQDSAAPRAESERPPSLTMAASTLAVRQGAPPLAAVRGASALAAIAAVVVAFEIVRVAAGPAPALLAAVLLLGSSRLLLEIQWGTGRAELALWGGVVVLALAHLARSPRWRTRASVAGAVVLFAAGAAWAALAGATPSWSAGAAALANALRGEGSLVQGMLGALVPMAAASALSTAWRGAGRLLVLWLGWAAALCFVPAPGPAGDSARLALTLAAAGPIALLVARTTRILPERVNRPLLVTALALALGSVALDGLTATAATVERSRADHGKISEIARFLAGVESIDEAWLLEPETDARAPQIVALARPRVRGWSGDVDAVCDADASRLLIDPAARSELLDGLAAASGTTTFAYGQGRESFRGLVLGPAVDEAAPPPPPPPSVAPSATAAATEPIGFHQQLASSHRVTDLGEAANAIDGNLATRWSSAAPQTGTEWFRVDLATTRRLAAVWVDTTATPHEFPRQLTLETSVDGVRFEPAATAASPSPRQHLVLESPRAVRAVRLLQTGAAPSASWTIHELVLLAATDPATAGWGRLPPAALQASSFRGGDGAPPGAAVDGNPETRWDSGAKQQGGEWFGVELAEPGQVTGLRLDMRHAGNDFPRGLRVLVSNDGQSYDARAEVGGSGPWMYLPIQPPAAARFLRLEQTGSDPFFWWSIPELELYGHLPRMESAALEEQDPERHLLPWERDAPPVLARVAPSTLPCRIGPSLPPAAAPSGDAAAAPLPAEHFALSSYKAVDRALRNAVDGDAVTRWDTGAAQRGGEWIQVDLPAPATIVSVVLDASGSGNDAPRRLRVSSSLDGAVFQSVLVRDAPGMRAALAFDPPLRSRSLRFDQLGEDSQRFWSLHELSIVGVYDAGAVTGPEGSRASPVALSALALLAAGVAWTLGARAGAVPSPLALARRAAGRARSLRRDAPRAARRVLVGVALSALTAILVLAGQDGWLPFVTWLGSLAVGFGALAAGRTDRARLLPRWEWLLVAAMVLLAAWFRLHQIDQQPTGLWIDELRNATHAIELAERSGAFRPFGATPLVYENWVKTSNLYLYFTWCVLWLGGVTRLAVKLVSVLPGIAAVPLTYLHGRRFVRWPAALAAAGWLATSLWHVTLSRWGWDEVLVTALVVAGFAKLWDAMTRRDRFSLAVAGAIFGLALYGYIAARLALAAALVAIGIDLWARRDPRWAAVLGWFGVGVGMVALPLAMSWLADPASFMVRVNELSILDQVFAGDVDVLIKSVRAHLLMFNVHGDVNARHNLPGVPMLDAWSGALFLLGVVVAIARIRRPESLLLLSWIGFGLLGGILSGLQESPQAYRTGMIAPACLLVAALGLDAVLALLTVSRRRWGVLVSAPLVVALIAASGVVTYRRYFHERAECAGCWGSMYEAAHATLIARSSAALAGGGVSVYLDSGLASGPLRFEIDELLLRREPKPAIEWRAGATLDARALDHAVLFVSPGGLRGLPEALRTLPHRVHTNRFGEELYATVSGRPELLPD
jgi:hypothetical protein